MSRTRRKAKDFAWPVGEKAKYRKTEREYKKFRSGRERTLQRNALSHMEYDDLSHEQVPWDNRLTHCKGDWWY